MADNIQTFWTMAPDRNADAFTTHDPTQAPPVATSSQNIGMLLDNDIIVSLINGMLMR